MMDTLDKIKQYMKDRNFTLEDNIAGDCFYLAEFDVIFLHQVSGFKVLRASTNSVLGFLRDTK